MKTGLGMILVACWLLALGNSIAVGQDQKAQFTACIDAGFAALVSEKSQDFSSPQYRIVCQKDDRDEAFTYAAPAGFLIEEARFKVDTKTVWTSVDEPTADGSRTTVELHCDVSKSNGSRHIWIAGHVTGRLAYQPTVKDAKDVAGACLDQILR